MLEALNAGRIPTVNLNEFLALDLPLLACNVAATWLRSRRGTPAGHAGDAVRLPPVRRHLHVARALHDLTAPRADRDRIAHALATHPERRRALLGRAVDRLQRPALPAKLDAVWRFAADPHFGVREMAWMAVRDEIAADVDAAVRLLQAWATHADPNIRRFASESTRPRGVWCAQIEALKKRTLARPAAAGAAARRREPLRAELGGELAERRGQDAAAVGQRGVRALEPRARPPATPTSSAARSAACPNE